MRERESWNKREKGKGNQGEKESEGGARTQKRIRLLPPSSLIGITLVLKLQQKFFLVEIK